MRRYIHVKVNRTAIIIITHTLTHTHAFKKTKQKKTVFKNVQRKSRRSELHERQEP